MNKYFVNLIFINVEVGAQREKGRQSYDRLPICIRSQFPSISATS
jgi:hypothetical protein